MVALVLEDWELGRVVLSSHMAVDLLCQEMRDASWVSSESLGSPASPFESGGLVPSNNYSVEAGCASEARVSLPFFCAALFV